MTRTSETQPGGERRKGVAPIALALVLGVALGGFLPANEYPRAYDFFHFLSQAFIALIKGLVVPLIVSTVVVGVAQTRDFRAVRRLGWKALLYFEVVTTLALALGLVVANFVRPGDGLPLNLAAKTDVVPKHPPSGWDLALHAFPSNLAKHAAEGDLLPIVVFSILFGLALVQLGDRGARLLDAFDTIAHVMFRYTGFVMRLTPLGVFGAMAYNMSHMAAGHEVEGVTLRGWEAVAYLLGRYAKLVSSLYGSLLLLVFLVFIPILLLLRVKIGSFFRAIRTPILTAYTTASSEAALPRLLTDLQEFGVPKRIASFVVPAGYSFNLDGSTLYLVLASLTIAQAAKMDLPLSRQLAMLFTFMLTSKGVAGVPRATLVIIAGTSAGFGLPGEAGVAMILAVDEIMDMARSATNVTGNALAAVVIAKWEGVFGVKDQEPALPTGPSSVENVVTGSE